MLNLQALYSSFNKNVNYIETVLLTLNIKRINFNFIITSQIVFYDWMVYLTEKIFLVQISLIVTRNEIK